MPLKGQSQKTQHSISIGIGNGWEEPESPEIDLRKYENFMHSRWYINSEENYLMNRVSCPAKRKEG